MLETIKGNILNATEGIIIHQCNCVGAFGGNLAGQIAKKYPIVRVAYKELYAKVGGDAMFGRYQKVQVAENLSVVNLFSQFNHAKGINDRNLYTDYRAMESALRLLHESVPMDTAIFVPYGLGCGLANGDWRRVHKILNKVFKDRKEVYIIEYSKFD